MIYEQKGLNKKEYTPVFGDEDDFSHLAGNVAIPKTTAYRHTEQHVPWISTPHSTDTFQRMKEQKQSLAIGLPTSPIVKWKSLTRY